MTLFPCYYQFNFNRVVRFRYKLDKWCLPENQDKVQFQKTNNMFFLFQIREANFQDEFLSVPTPSRLRHPDLHYATLLCNSLSPWSKTGAFYYPRWSSNNIIIHVWYRTFKSLKPWLCWRKAEWIQCKYQSRNRLLSWAWLWPTKRRGRYSRYWTWKNIFVSFWAFAWFWTDTDRDIKETVIPEQFQNPLLNPITLPNLLERGPRLEFGANLTL